MAKALIADPRIVVSPGGTRTTAPSRRGFGSLCAHSRRSDVGQVLAAGLTVLPLAPVSRVELAKVLRKVDCEHGIDLVKSEAAAADVKDMSAAAEKAKT
jgi:hypothetical protein